MMPSQKRPSALTAKLPLKAIPIVNPNVDAAVAAGGTDGAAAPAASQQQHPTSDKPTAFDPSISEFVPQALGTCNHISVTVTKADVMLGCSI